MKEIHIQGSKSEISCCRISFVLQSITELSDEEGGEALSNNFASVRLSQTLVEGGSQF